MKHLNLHLGALVRAEEGFRDLRKGVDYYFLSSAFGAWRFIFFELVNQQKSSKNCNQGKEQSLIARTISLREEIASEAFEHGMLSIHSPMQPPFSWMGTAVPSNPKLSEAHQSQLSNPHHAAARKRLAIISPALAHLEQVLLAAQPEKILNEFAASANPKVNTVRYRTWFFAYVLSGQRENSLLPRLFSHWTATRKASVRTTKRGRPSIAYGRGHGHNMTPEMRELCVKGYDAHKGLGRKLTRIYRRTLRHQFGCRSRRSGYGFEFFHPGGLPFPSRHQFRQVIMKEIGQRQVKLNKVGPMRMLNEYDVNKGSYTENIGYAYQVIEDDGAHIKDRPRCVFGNEIHPALVVVIKVDRATSAEVGIGFSSGSETAQAYRDADFCSAIDKVKFCQLFGLRIEPDDWPMKGLGPSQLRDRGAGATKRAQSSDPVIGPVFQGITPTACGRAKPTVETSHSKTSKNQEPKNFQVSKLTTVQLAVEAIKDLLKHNSSLNVTDKVPPGLTEEIHVATPNALYKALVSRGRTVSAQIPFDEAVRNFLAKTSARLTREGLKWHGHTYTSATLKRSGMLERIAKGHSIDVDVYALSLVPQRYVWIDFKGTLIEVELSFKISVSEAVLQVSLEDLKYREEKLNLIHSRTEEQRAAAEELFDQLGEEQTGIGDQRETYMSGPPPSRKSAGHRP
ncbi:MAG: hypothetical protein SF172_15100 [Burkholderiales bacterium]|nr:hypothetical protein [Burkholderiales bacterium]